jgi:hypothetical protein
LLPTANTSKTEMYNKSTSRSTNLSTNYLRTTAAELTPTSEQNPKISSASNKISKRTPPIKHNMIDKRNKNDVPSFSVLLVCAGQPQTLDCKTEPIRLVEAFEYVSTLNVCEYE